MRTITFIIFIFTCAHTKAQVNYVLNPDFEMYSVCPTTLDNISLATYWSAVDSININTCVPEYCNTCVTIGPLSVPGGGFYYQHPHSGNGFAQTYIYCDHPGNQGWLRDYLQGRLHISLTSGKSYCVSFYVCLSEVSRYAIDKIGAYLDDGSIDTSTNCNAPLTAYTPQVQNSLGIISDTMNWTKIEGTFVANGTEKFITLGNFYSVANTDTVWLDDNSYNFQINDNYAYYLFDDVSVIETNLPAFAGNDTWVVEGDSVFIGRTPEVGLDCKWLANGNVIDSGAGIWVHPTVTTTYVVEQTICGLVKTDTVTIEVWAASVNGITNGQQVSIYPNPATNQLLVKQERVVFTEAVIVNQLGQQVYAQALTGKETKVDISSLHAGVYSITLVGEKGKEVRRFVKL